MELIKGYISTIQLPIPATATSLSASVYDTDGDVVASNLDITEPERGVSMILLPYSVVDKERELLLKASFAIEGSTYNKEVVLDVTTPYLELFELEKILESTDEEECWRVESAVRHIINSHCGQQFGLTDAPQRVVGNKESMLSFTRPVIKLDSLTENGVRVFDSALSPGRQDYSVIGDGWFIKRPEYRVSSIKEHSYFTSEPIKAPNTFYDNSFINDGNYVATGTFGYTEVPDEIREAAKLLVNDYGCPDGLYRDRYLKSVRAADWRIEFAAGAWKATGNARADALLNQHVVNRIVIF